MQERATVKEPEEEEEEEVETTQKGDARKEEDGGEEMAPEMGQEEDNGGEQETESEEGEQEREHDEETMKTPMEGIVNDVVYGLSRDEVELAEEILSIGQSIGPPKCPLTIDPLFADQRTKRKKDIPAVSSIARSVHTRTNRRPKAKDPDFMTPISSEKATSVGNEEVLLSVTVLFLSL